MIDYKLIKELRTKNNYTQSKLSSLLGVSRSTVSMWEIGSSEPDTATISKMAELFGVTTDYLLGREERKLTLDEELEGIEFALYGEIHDLTEEEKRDILSYVQFKKSQRGE